ncbi:MAG: extracellular solute-binding protein [Paenibacillaceae bacterium]|nr:extracellular solute-binding protein [Paenibacillaceae bacterium]
MRQRKGWLAAWLIVGLLAMLVAGCSGKSDKTTGQAAASATPTQTDKAGTSDKSDKKVNLRLYTVSALDKDEFDRILPEWNKLHPNISVELVVLTGADSWDKIRIGIAGGEKIDIAIMERDTFRDKASKMYLKLNDLMKKDNLNYLQEFGAYGRATMIGDDIYGIAKILSPSVVIYNQSVLDKTGVPLPDENTWTFDDYFNWIAKLTQKSADGKSTVFGGMHWQGALKGILDLAIYGGWDIVTADGKPNINSPILKKAADLYYKAIFTDKSMPSNADVNATKLNAVYGTLSGELGSTLAASNNMLGLDDWKVTGQMTQEADDKNWIRMAKMPRWDASSPANQITTIVTGYSITKTSEHPDEAYQFLKWYTTKGLELSAKVAKRIPAWTKADSKQLFQDWRFYKDKNGTPVEGKSRDEMYKKIVDPAQVAIFPKYRADYEYSSRMLEELTKELTLVLADEKKVEPALADAQKAAQAIYDKEKK